MALAIIVPYTSCLIGNELVFSPTKTTASDHELFQVLGIIKLAHDSSGFSQDPFVKRLVRFSLPDCKTDTKPEGSEIKPGEEMKEEHKKPK